MVYFYVVYLFRNNRKLRVVHIAIGSVGTRYSLYAPLLVVDFVNTNGVFVRGYTFTKSLVRSVPEVLHLDDIVLVRGGLVEVSDADYTWVKSSVAIKLVSNTEFFLGKPDDSFAFYIFFIGFLFFCFVS